jgi:hypothetical protein
MTTTDLDQIEVAKMVQLEQMVLSIPQDQAEPILEILPLAMLQELEQKCITQLIMAIILQ